MLKSDMMKKNETGIEKGRDREMQKGYFKKNRILWSDSNNMKTRCSYLNVKR